MTTPPLRSVLAALLFAECTGIGTAAAQDFLAPPAFDGIVVASDVDVEDETSPARLDDAPTLQPVPTATSPKIVIPEPTRTPEPPTPEPTSPKPEAATKTVAEVVPQPLPARPADPLDRLVDAAIDATSRRMLVVVDEPGFQADENTPWQIAHGILALRHDYFIRVDDRRVNAIEYVATNPLHMDEPWFLKTRWGGKGHPYTEKWQFEGHPNQFLAFFATAGLPKEFEIQAGPDESFTLEGWIRNAQMEVNDKEEITWTLWAFSTYLPPDARWVDQYNRGWSIEKLVRMQIDKHPTKAACGGMHGLFAVANALNAYDRTGERRRGVWLEAEQYVQTHIAGIKSLQNRDGSFSSNYLKGPEYSDEVDKRVSTTGHTLEFLVNGLSDKQLREPWVRAAIQRVADDLVRYKSQPMEPGGMYHACDALVIYRQRTRPEYAAPRALPQVVEEPRGRATSAREPIEEENEFRRTSGETPTRSELKSIDPADPAFVLPIPVESETSAGEIQQMSADAPARPEGDTKPRQPAPDQRQVPLPGPIISPRR